MLTDCPSCQTRYDVEDRLLRRRGRRIRCSVCTGTWFLLPPDSRRGIEIPTIRITAPLASVTAPSAPVLPPPVSPVVGSRVATPQRRPMLPRVAVRKLLPAGAALVATAGLMALVGLRETIVRHVPQMGVAYAAVGLPVNLRGLEFRDIKSTLVTDHGRRLLAVEGVIAQVGRHGAAVPDLRVAVRDPSGREIYSWTTPAPRARLARGETTQFRARLAAPPVAGTQVRVQFAEATRR